MEQEGARAEGSCLSALFRGPPLQRDLQGHIHDLQPLDVPTLEPQVGSTHAGQLNAAVAAFRVRSSLLDVKEPELATGRLDDPRPVGLGVVSALHDD